MSIEQRPNALIASDQHMRLSNAYEDKDPAVYLPSVLSGNTGHRFQQIPRYTGVVVRRQQTNGNERTTRGTTVEQSSNTNVSYLDNAVATEEDVHDLRQ